MNKKINVMKKYKDGQIIKLSESQHEKLLDLVYRLSSYRETIADLSERIGKGEKESWKLINEWFGGTKDYKMNISLKNDVLTVSVINKLPNEQKDERSAKIE